MMLVKKYEYYLLIFYFSDGGEISRPMAFDVGMDPKAYCEEQLKIDWQCQAKDTSRKFQRYEYYRLNLQDTDQACGI